jgi:hypothetical protein
LNAIVHEVERLGGMAMDKGLKTLIGTLQGWLIALVNPVLALALLISICDCAQLRQRRGEAGKRLREFNRLRSAKLGERVYEKNDTRGAMR